mmetsp:Transcript_37616/g.100047  ORF Transcript_37616/g.100047 Transcript_37616/m.100047 type:complete len:363 (+) Transcript_37616:1187-2275(+)
MPLLGDGELSQPVGQEGHLPRIGLPCDLNDTVSGPLIHARVPPRYRRVLPTSLPHDHVRGHMVLDLAGRNRCGSTRCVFRVRVGKSGEFLAWSWDLSNGPAFHAFAERWNRQEVHTNGATNGHVRRVHVVDAVVRSVQTSYSDAMTHCLCSDGLRQLQTDLYPWVINLLRTEALVLQVAPETDLNTIRLLAPLIVHGGVVSRVLFFDMLQEVCGCLVDEPYLQVAQRSDVIRAPLLPNNVTLFPCLAIELHQISHDLFGFVTALHRQVQCHLFLTDHGHVCRNFTFECHVRPRIASNEFLPVDLVLAFLLLELEVLLPTAFHRVHDGALLLQSLGLLHFVPCFQLGSEAKALPVERLHLNVL